MEIRTLIYGLAVFLISAVALTVLGLGGPAGNATGVLFWALLAVLGVAFAISRVRHNDENVVRVARRVRDREPG